MKQGLQKLRNRIERVQAQIEAIQEEHGSNVNAQAELDRLKQLKRNYIRDNEIAKKNCTTKMKLRTKKHKNRPRWIGSGAILLTKKKKETLSIEERLNSTKALDDLKQRLLSLTNRRGQAGNQRRKHFTL